MTIIKKIINFIIDHPIISMLVTGLIFTFVAGYSTKQWNIAYFLPAIILFAFLAPFIRKAQAKKQKKNEADYLAKKIAEEVNKNK